MIVMPCNRRLLSKLYPSESYVSVEHVNCDRVIPLRDSERASSGGDRYCEDCVRLDSEPQRRYGERCGWLPGVACLNGPAQLEASGRGRC